MQMNNNVPDCWDIKKLDAIAKIQRGRFSIRPRNDPAYYGGTTPFVQTGDISQSEIFLKKYSQTLNDKGVAVSKIFPKNTILITIAANIGDTAITTFPVACPDSLIGINNKSCDVFWLNYFLQTQKNKLNGLATQNAQKNINLETLNNLKIAVPPIAEQKKIAEILVTWDRAIEELTGLIAEKKELKRGLMQRLLTGTQRLPSFAKPWSNIQLKQLGECIRGVSYKPVDLRIEDAKDTVRLLRSSNVQNDKLTLTDLKIVPMSIIKKSQILQQDDIVICMSNGSKDLVGKAAKYDLKDGYTYTVGAFCAIFRVNGYINKNFFNYHFFTDRYTNWINLITSGSSINNLKNEDIESFKIYVPADEEEQKAIADVLSKADSEIDLLNQQLDLLKEQKRGLMQKLLTGEIRVKVDNE